MIRGIVTAVAFLAAACVVLPLLPATPPAHRSDAMEISARMLRQLGRLEADLHASSGEIETYTELVARHGQAQQVACRVTDEHIQEIHRLALLQQQKRQEKRQERQRRRHAVARVHAQRKFALR
jgi:hypothetical protein